MNSAENRVERIQTALINALAPIELEVIDESADHIGHNNQGGGHFNLKITSNAFIGKSLVERHKMVYDAIGDLMKTDIHALSIHAKIPS